MLLALVTAMNMLPVIALRTTSPVPVTRDTLEMESNVVVSD